MYLLHVLGVGLDDFADAVACVLIDVGDEFLLLLATDEQVSLPLPCPTSSSSRLAADSNFSVFFDSCLPLCSAMARVAIPLPRRRANICIRD